MGGSGSKSNEAEAEAVRLTLSSLLAGCGGRGQLAPSQVGVVTPYKAQDKLEEAKRAYEDSLMEDKLLEAALTGDTGGQQFDEDFEELMRRFDEDASATGVAENALPSIVGEDF